MAGYTKNITFTDGTVISAAPFNTEYGEIDAAFSASTGHSHDGTVGGGSPLTLLLLLHYS